MSKNYIGFTLDMRKLTNVLSQDPSVRAEIIQGLQDPPLPLTTQLGAANLTAGQGHDTWCSVFPATVEGAVPGQVGLLYRNNTRGGKGDRIQMRLKPQPPKQQAAQTVPQYQAPVAQPAYQVPVAAPVAAPVATTPARNPLIEAAARSAGISYEQALAQLVANAGGPRPAQAPAAQPVVATPAPAQAAPVGANGLPAHMTAALDGLNIG